MSYKNKCGYFLKACPFLNTVLSMSVLECFFFYKFGHLFECEVKNCFQTLCNIAYISELLMQIGSGENICDLS